MIQDKQTTQVRVSAPEAAEIPTPIARQLPNLTDEALLLLRLVLGAVFIAHGGQKVFGWFGGHGLEGTAQFMATMGVPTALAYLAAFTEFFGGLALVGGLLTRLASLGLFFTMAVAIVKVHLAGGFFAPQGFEYPLALAAMALALVLTGAGRYSLDRLVFARRGK